MGSAFVIYLWILVPVALFVVTVGCIVLAGRRMRYVSFRVQRPVSGATRRAVIVNVIIREAGSAAPCASSQPLRSPSASIPGGAGRPR
ncbi:hypothetical protein [Actinomadura sp. WMMB 499]|uniref:hypothetical protein n=1 Tax=Actinomadura sp. WMMB 499 TaxID=1219491 RepID=UPI00124854CE|nr:hypothetical protein [Actinomadura sp. WMMB 499]QFG25305.1 hypothetical protein F7P10_33305 [Actinomadura sp. WMMB 499]